MDLAHLMCDCRYVVSTDAILFITPRGFCSIAENSFHPIQYSLYQCTTQNLWAVPLPVVLHTQQYPLFCADSI